MPSDAIRIGVIGAWGRGSLALHAHKPEEGSQIVAAADIVAANIKELEKKAGSKIEGFSDYKKLLARKDINTVFITAPDFLHEEMAVASLKAGKAVYLEKPMAITIEGCDRILKAAKGTGSKLFVGHNMRYMKFTNELRRLVQSGVIGEVKHIWCRHFISYGGDAYFRDWHSERKNTTSLLLQKGAHDIDIIHWLAGGYTERVTAMGSLAVYDKCQRRSPKEPGCATFNSEHWPPLEQTGFSPKIDVEDMYMMLMQLDNGVQACYLENHFTPDCCRNYCVIGTHGRLENYGEDKIKIWNKRCDVTDLIKCDQEVDASYTPEEGSHGGADPKIVAEFLDFVRKGVQTAATPQAARYSVAAGVAATESLRKGGMPVDIPPLPKSLA